jgi:hypothetical protein
MSKQLEVEIVDGIEKGPLRCEHASCYIGTHVPSLGPEPHLKPVSLTITIAIITTITTITTITIIIIEYVNASNCAAVPGSENIVHIRSQISINDDGPVVSELQCVWLLLLLTATTTIISSIITTMSY